MRFLAPGLEFSYPIYSPLQSIVNKITPLKASSTTSVDIVKAYTGAKDPEIIHSLRNIWIRDFFRNALHSCLKYVISIVCKRSGFIDFQVIDRFIDRSVDLRVLEEFMDLRFMDPRIMGPRVLEESVNLRIMDPRIMEEFIDEFMGRFMNQFINLRFMEEFMEEFMKGFIIEFAERSPEDWEEVYRKWRSEWRRIWEEFK
jgi:hypothetical protein